MMTFVSTEPITTESKMPITINAYYELNHAKVLNSAKQLCDSLECTVYVEFLATMVTSVPAITSVADVDKVFRSAKDERTEVKIVHTIEYDNRAMAHVTSVEVRPL